MKKNPKLMRVMNILILIVLLVIAIQLFFLWYLDAQIVIPRSLFMFLFISCLLLAFVKFMVIKTTTVTKDDSFKEDPYDFDYDYDDDSTCPKCGHSPIALRDCTEFNCENGEIDEYHDDSINFHEGESYRVCTECYGSGVESWCPICGCDIAKHNYDLHIKSAVTALQLDVNISSILGAKEQYKKARKAGDRIKRKLDEL